MKKEHKIIILAVVLTAFITSFTGSALNMAIPDISSYFAAGAGLSGWVVTGYTLTVAVFSIPSGCVADMKGRKLVLVTGLVIFTAAALASGLSVSIMMLIICRAVQGIGAAMIFSTNTAILAEVFSEHERGKVLGYSLAATYVGLSAGPVLGGILNYNLGWRTIFNVTAVISLAALALAIKALPADRRSGNDITWRGSVRLDVFKNNPGFVCSNLAALLNYGATFVISYLLSIYLQVVLGYSSQTAGMILLIQPVIISVLSPIAGKRSDSVSPFTLASIGMIVCAAGIAAGLMLDTGHSVSLFSKILTEDAVHAGHLWSVALVLAVVGVGSALFSSPNTNAVMSCVEKSEYSIASSALSTMRALGNTLGMLAVTIVTHMYIGDTVLKQAAPQMIIKTMMTVFIISIAACIAGIFLAKRK